MTQVAGPSPRRRAWSGIAILTLVFASVLALVSLYLVPVILNLQGTNAASNAFFATGIGSLLLGLVGIGATPRRASTVYLQKTRRFRGPSFAGGVIALSLVFSGIIMIIAAAMTSA